MSTPSDQFKTIADTLSNLKRVLLLDDEASQSVKRACLSSGNSIVCPSLGKRREEEMVAVRDQKGGSGLQREEEKSGSDSSRKKSPEMVLVWNLEWRVLMRLMSIRRLMCWRSP